MSLLLLIEYSFKYVYNIQHLWAPYFVKQWGAKCIQILGWES